MAIRKSDSQGQRYDAFDPKLRTARDIRRDKKLRDELYGENKKPVSLPTFKFMDKKEK